MAVKKTKEEPEKVLARIEEEKGEAHRLRGQAEDALAELAERGRAEKLRIEERQTEEQRGEYNALASKRAGLEQDAQEGLAALIAVLDELESVDLKQREAGRQLDGVGVENFVDWPTIAGWWLSAWIGPRMSGASTGHPDNRRPLRELSPLSEKALTPAEIENLQEERDREAAERRREEERARKAHERAEMIESRRYELRARAGHETAPDYVRPEIEAGVEELLSREFPQEELETSEAK